MNQERRICQSCKIKDSCPPILDPVIVGRSGDRMVVTKDFKYVPSTWCGNYTCGQDGEQVERATARLVNESSDLVEVTEADGSIHSIRALAFRTSEKRTDVLKHRVISSTGQVYAYQDEMYYATQLIELN